MAGRWSACSARRRSKGVAGESIDGALGADGIGRRSGQVLEVRVDDPAARVGVPAWRRLAGHTLLATIEDDEGSTRFFLRKR